MGEYHQDVFVIPTAWSPNIGNAFFALGIQYALKQAVPEAQIVLLSDQAAYLNFIPGSHYRHEPRNSLRYLELVRPKYIVLSGSLLTEQFPAVWGDALRSLHRAGTKILLIGVGYYEYSERERTLCRELLSEYPPYVLVSRDHRTFEDLCAVANYAYDGIDGAYFTPEVFQPIPTELPPYIVLNFDKTIEPRIRVLAQGFGQPKTSAKTNCFEFEGSRWILEFPRIRFAVSELLGKGAGFAFGLLGLYGTSQSEVANFTMVRTDHSLNPLMLSRIFRGPNAFAGDLPYSYLNIYSQSKLTLTDRIHAALVTMSYGGPAMLLSKSGRASIIERVGGGGVTRKPTFLDMDALAQEKHAMLDFLKSVPW